MPVLSHFSNWKRVVLWLFASLLADFAAICLVFAIDVCVIGSATWVSCRTNHGHFSWKPVRCSLYSGMDSISPVGSCATLTHMEPKTSYKKKGRDTERITPKISPK